MSPKGSQLAEMSGSPFLEMVAGGDRGQVFSLDAGKLSFGRSDDNDVVIASEAVSRYHAILERQGAEWVIRDNQSKNGVQVNGTSVESCALQPGDVVQLGNFAFRFQDPAAPMSMASPSSQAMAMLDPGPSAMDLSAPVPRRKRPNRRILIYSIAGLLLYALYNMSTEPEKTPVKEDQKTEAKEGEVPKLARDFKVAAEPNLENKTEKQKLVGIEDPTLKAAEVEMSKLDWSNSSLREAEQYFKKGQREYLNKNYARSIDAFQTALSIYRGHELADKYLRLAIFDAETLAKKHMETGVRYFESLQYQRAIYHFTEVIALMTHRPSEPIVAESEKYILISKQRLKAAELFP